MKFTRIPKHTSKTLTFERAFAWLIIVCAAVVIISGS